MGAVVAAWKRLDDLSESDRHARISFEAVGVWSYLIGTSDSCGRRSGDAEILRRKVFTLRANVTDKWIDDRLEELSSVGLIHLYSVDTRRHLVMHRYGKYNPGAHLKARPSFPAPADPLCDCLIFHESEARPPELWRNYGPVRSGEVPSVLSEGDKEGTGEPSGGFPEVKLEAGTVGWLIRQAHDSKIMGNPDTIRKFVEGWNIRVGAQETERMIVENAGKTVMEIHNRYFPLNGTARKKPDTCKHGKSLMYGIPCRKCDEERR